MVRGLSEVLSTERPSIGLRSRPRSTTIRRARVSETQIRPPHSAATGGKSVSASAVSAVVVAVPARNEAGTIAACLASIDSAAAEVDLPVMVVVAADTCRDDTVDRARSVPVSYCSVDVIEGGWRSAGGARRAAVDAALQHLVAASSTVWIANTDADCVVPNDWIRCQLGYAARGKVAVAGTVMLDPATTSEMLLAAFVATYGAADRTHRHVHAANLGLRADVYEVIGGWSAHTVVGEDHDLWRRLRLAGADVIQPLDVPVVTASRTAGRIVGGFASALARLERHLDQMQPAS
jgi:glycosyltransferase involved in cell wall biosynthesis